MTTREPRRQDDEVRVSPRDASAPPSPLAAAAGCMRPLGAIALAGAVIFAAGGGLLAGRLLLPAPSTTQEIVYRGPSVVTAVRDLARLESARFHMERVIDLKERQSTLFGLIESDDAILLVAAADVTAGVDLDKLGEDAVRIDEAKRHVVITLPPPEVFDAVLDTERTYVHHRKTDLLADRKEDLETRARKEATKELEKAAIAAGIIERAKTNAERTVVALVRSLGFESVEVRFADTD
jgi:hypothetical protein